VFYFSRASGGGAETSIEVYDEISNKWTVTAEMPETNCACSILAV